MKHDNNFDLLRLLAASQVVFTHCIKWLNLESAINEHIYNLVFGFPGVAVFFVISGFLISRSWLEPKTTSSVYWDHRVRRIYPALWTNIAVLLIALYVADCLVLDSPEHFIAWTIAAFVTGSDYIASVATGVLYHPGFYPDFPSGVLWTLPVELCFYVLVPLIFQKRMQRSRIAALIVACFSASLIFQCYDPEAGGPYSITRFLWIFLLGGSISLFWDRLKRIFVDRAIVWIPLYLAFNFSTQRYGLDYWRPGLENIVQTILLACTTISVAHSFRPLFGILRGNDISYGLYLWHMPVIWTMRGFDFTGRWRWMVVAYLIACSIAAMSWVLIERPVLKRKKRGAAHHAAWYDPDTVHVPVTVAVAPPV